MHVSKVVAVFLATVTTAISTPIDSSTENLEPRSGDNLCGASTFYQLSSGKTVFSGLALALSSAARGRYVIPNSSDFSTILTQGSSKKVAFQVVGTAGDYAGGQDISDLATDVARRLSQCESANGQNSPNCRGYIGNMNCLRGSPVTWRIITL